MPSATELWKIFEVNFWPGLRQRHPLSMLMNPVYKPIGWGYWEPAIRWALWDLAARQAGLPLYELMGGSPEKRHVPAYGSGLDYPLSDREAGDLFQSFAARGFRAVKVKVGRPNPGHDLRRLEVVRDAVGPSVTIAVDANLGWSPEEAIERIRMFQQHGIEIAYLEDPLPDNDVAGLARLQTDLGIDLAGHDYVDDPRTIRLLLENDAIRRVRCSATVEYSCACARLASEFHVPVAFGNTPFEMGVHAAAALTAVDLIEFSDLDWNRLPDAPVRVEDGHLVAPNIPGHGLQIKPELIGELQVN